MGEVGGGSVCVTEPVSKPLYLAERHRMLTAVAGIKKLPPLFYYFLLSVFKSLMVFGTAGFVSEWFLGLPRAQCQQPQKLFPAWLYLSAAFCSGYYNALSNTDPAPHSPFLYSKNEFIVFLLAFPFYSHASTKSLLSDLLLKPSRIINI